MGWLECFWKDSIRESEADMEKGFVMDNHVITVSMG